MTKSQKKSIRNDLDWAKSSPGYAADILKIDVVEVGKNILVSLIFKVTRSGGFELRRPKKFREFWEYNRRGTMVDCNHSDRWKFVCDL